MAQVDRKKKTNHQQIDRESDEEIHEKISLNLSKLLQQARMAKGLTQVELAKKINEKHQVVHDYELGKGIPNQRVLTKMERVMGVKLREGFKKQN